MSSRKRICIEWINGANQKYELIYDYHDKRVWEMFSSYMYRVPIL